MHRREFIKLGIAGSAGILRPQSAAAEAARAAESRDAGPAPGSHQAGGDNPLESDPGDFSALAAGFAEPPPVSRPYVWWHWVNRNVSKEGITADLEALRRIGIGGAQAFSIDYQVPRGPVQYLTPEWLDALRHAAQEAERLGLDLGMHNCSGWSSSGGPWITPDLAMQKVVSTETRVTGPVAFQGPIPRASVPRYAKFYRDIAVLACRTPDAELQNPPRGYRLPEWPGKAGFGPLAAFHPAWTESVPRDSVYPLGEIVDLSASLTDADTLTWDVPPGEWTILRFGYGPNGRPNTHPEVPAGFGLEVDKMNRAALDLHFAKLIAAVLQDLGPLAGKTFTNLLIDSYEVGPSNWTPRFREEFQLRRGYNLTPYLAALTGRVVESTEITERFLWDFRRTIADLYHDNYYSRFTELCRARGLTSAFEPYLGPFAILDNGAVAGLPMAEFWTGNGYRKRNARNRLVTSGGHLAGRRIVAAEAFTSAWNNDRFTQDPFSLKAIADFQFCEGINRFYFHDFTHQPWVNRMAGPGLTMGPWGMHFARTVTWWEQGKPWIDYVTRCQYLLQAGAPVADIFCYTGEDAGAQPRWADGALPPVPPGYDFEFVNADGLLAARMEDGAIVLPRGQKSRVLVIPDTRHLTPAVAQKLGRLVAAGATLVGPPPALSPSLANYPACDATVREVAKQIWGNCDGQTVTEHRVGRGKACWGRPLADILTGVGLQPDFAGPALEGFAQLNYKHRTVSDAEIYFIANPGAEPITADCRFRVEGQAPEFWQADTGVREPAPLYVAADGFTTVPLRLDPSGSVFVVFRRAAACDHAVVASGDFPRAGSGAAIDPADFSLGTNAGALVLRTWRPGEFRVKTAAGRRLHARVESLPEPILMNEDWEVTFPAKLGAPAAIRLAALTSLSRHADAGVRFFSGTARYSRDFEVPDELLTAGREVFLDLGMVKNLAQVKINGVDLGIAWKSPFRMRATRALRPGRNHLEVQVTNLWANRLIGDETLPADCEWIAVPNRGWRLKDWPRWLVEGKARPSPRIAFATWRYYDGSEPLPDSGLIGPVQLRVLESVELVGA